MSLSQEEVARARELAEMSKDPDAEAKHLAQLEQAKELEAALAGRVPELSHASPEVEAPHLNANAAQRIRDKAVRNARAIVRGQPTEPYTVSEVAFLESQKIELPLLESKSERAIRERERAAVMHALNEMREWMLTHSGYPSRKWYRDFVNTLYPIAAIEMKEEEKNG